MPVLYHNSFCPHSRFIRIVTSELDMDVEMVEERSFDRRPEFLSLNPAGTTPVIVEGGSFVVPEANVIAEYLDETRGLVMGDKRLLPDSPAARVEVRRLMHWFNAKFFDEVSHYLVQEKIYKRYMTNDQARQFGGLSPDTNLVRAARANIKYHLSYISYLTRQRNWLAGDQLSYADLAAAAHISVCDYLSDVPWDGEPQAKEWYARIKSRPSFRAILADRMPGTPPSSHYADLDF
jgi:glutathione S-transferase